MSAAGRALSKALDSSQDWTGDGKYTIKHRPSGMVFWVSNGPWFFDGHWPEEIQGSIGLAERWWLRLKAQKIIAKFARDRRQKPAKDLIARFKAAQK